MKFIDIIRMCLRNLTKHKARTILTVMGVFIGTCAIIVMISLGIGMNETQTAMLSEWADLTLVQVYNYGGGGGVSMDGGSGSSKKAADITDEVIEQFTQIEHVKSVTPFYSQMYTGQQIGIYSGDFSLNYAPIIGVYMDEMENFGFKLKDGRFATKTDPKGTVLVGKGFGSDLYDYVNDEYRYCEMDDKGNITQPLISPMTDTLRMVPVVMDMEKWQIDYSIFDENDPDNIEYGLDLNVVGMLDGDWSSYESMVGVFIDINYMKELIKAYNELNPDNKMEDFKGVYSDVRIRVDDMNNVTSVEKALQDLGYQTSSSNEMRENMTKQTQTIQMMLGALAAISLFVAALNITNTMIMSIIERTKEIGIMKVLGCDINKIRLQFLGEAASIGFIGGIVGIGFSYLVSFLINTFLRDMMLSAMGGQDVSYSEAAAGMDISVIPIWLVFAALAFATLVGLISGFYPANKSVKISALSAISHD